ncbi:MAG: PstS family phosphate ABC transporter substrate-binding protein [Anaerolineae bacterium]|nr:PstS family phosphate ABC transporter substrate-binding protein [Thermoflexales bacterium]MDW8054222.1 PstS family phosphate ABC transporter substrate-binding protein [Anaerolineae bacterium]MDW8292258.1 PstS family phosphate ABC transporter substrate-binding protein [Anaerolineae bacterium]
MTKFSPKPLIAATAMAVLTSATLVGAAHAQKLPPVNPAALSGNIKTGGSSTVYPLSVRIVELFKRDGFPGEITVDNIGSGAGITRFCRGEYDVANSSRAMTQAEINTCRANGIEPIQFKVGIDALTIVVNPKNTWVRNLNRQQVALIFSGQAKTWKDVNRSWPDTPIKLYSPGTDSGTYDYFVEEVFRGIPAAQRRAIIPRVPGVQLSEDDNVLVAGVASDPGAIGYFGFAYYEENRSKLKAVNYEGVAPNAATVAAGRYKFARPLFIISSARILKDKPQVAGFVNYYLANVDKVIRAVGYFPEPAAELAKTRQQFLDALK